MDNDALLRAIDEAAEAAYGSDTDSDLAEQRAAAIDAYFGENTQPAPEGRSQVCDRTLFEVVESILPSLVRIYANGNDVVRCLPVGPDDQDGADQTTALLQWTVCEKNQWEQLFHDWAKDALLLKNGYMLAMWDNEQRVQQDRYEGQSDEQLAMLLQDRNIRVLQHSERPDEDENQRRAQAYQQQLQQYQMMQAQMQQPMMQPGMPQPQMPPPPQPPQPAMLHDVVIEQVDTEGKVRIIVLPPEHCLVGQDTPDFTLRDCRYFEFWELKTRGELMAMGLDVPEDLSDSDSTDTPEDDSRNRYNEEDEADEKLKVRMIWIRAADEDDVERLYYVIRVGQKILYVEPVSRIPVASITPVPLPHRHIGLGMWDILEDIQNTKQAITRSALDNLYLSINGRHAVSESVNLEDMLTVRPGGVVRMQSGAIPGEGHIQPIQHPFVFDQVVNSLTYFDQQKQNLSGVNAYFNGVDQNALNRTATGLSLMTTQSAQRVEQIARMFSVGVEYLFSCVLELVQKHANKQQIFNLRGKWYVVDPQAWMTKRDVRIAVGVGAGNKDTMLQQLQQMIAAQMQIGLPLQIATPANVYQTASEIAKLQGFSQPERFWVDPTVKPPQPPQPPIELVIEQQKQQAEAQRTQFEAQVETQKSAQEMAFEKWKSEQELANERWKAELDAQTKLAIEQMRAGTQKEVKAAELMSTHQIRGAEMEREDGDKADKEQLAQLAQALQAMQNMVQQMAQAGEGKRVVGVQKIKGPDGRMRAARVSRADGSIDEVPIQ